MKALISMKKLFLIPVIAAPLFFAMQANACHLHHSGWAHYPIAICATHATNAPLPVYVCCELEQKNGHHIWANTWVSGSCQNADPRAHNDMGCTSMSPVYGTNGPILAACQFSYSTGRYR
jgi:hypothetical protein